MSMPNFLIIGAAKSGTTALYHYLKQHPQVYMSPQKETNFFAFEGQEVRFGGPGDEQTSNSTITELTAYKEQFRGVTEEIAVGEASPWYLYSYRAAANIRRHVPDAKLIAVLRNPVDRAFSSYLHVVRHDRENLSFEEGLAAEKGRVEQDWEPIWHYQRVGLYAEQVRRFLDLFDQEQVRFYLYDDLLEDTEAFLIKVYEFLGVSSDFVADTSLRPNATGIPRNKLVQRLMFQPNMLKTAARTVLPDQIRYNLSQSLGRRSLVKPAISAKTREQLLDEFQDDILTAQDLTGLDLSGWLEREPAEKGKSGKLPSRPS